MANLLSAETWQGIWNLVDPLLHASIVSIEVFFLTLIIALPLAVPIAFGRMSKCLPIRYVVSAYQLVMRGTPLILQILFVYFAPYYLFKVSPSSRFWAVVFAFGMNYAAYFSEIFRGGIESIPQGQYEAAKVLGFTKIQTFFRIILPQVVKRIIPALSNEVITLVKDTALAQTIGVAELFRTAQTISARQFSVTPIFVAGAFYLFMNWVVTLVFSRIEKKLDYYK